MSPRETNAASNRSTDSSVVRSSITVPPDLVVGLLGSSDGNLRALERLLTADIHARGNAITLSGEPADVALAERAIAELIEIVASGQRLTPDAVRHSVAMLTGTVEESPAEVLTLDILSRRGKTIRPKTLNQKRYVDAIDAHTIVFGIGPAGTGKTYLAMAKAVNALQTKTVSRIILTRPAVEAGERLGFLPGTLSEKIDPYLRPLYDALHDMMDPELIPKLISAGVIEVAPLAYMRGRAQPLSTKVLTPNGFRAIGDLKVGDFVIGSSGRPTEVLGTYFQGFKEIYRVYTQDGSSTLASGDHLWSVYTRSDRRRGRPARVLMTKEMIGNLRAAHHHRYELPLLSAPVHFDSEQVPLDPYALGLLLGRGRGMNPVTAAMRQLGLAGMKSDDRYVPYDYLRNTPEVRLAVLQGLLDTDGEPVTQDGGTCRIQYGTASEQLADDVTFLVQSLGGVVDRRTRKAEGRKPGLAHGRDVLHRADAHLLKQPGCHHRRHVDGVDPASLLRSVRLTAWYSTRLMLLKPRRYGSFLTSGSWPPSKYGRDAAASRAFWPLVPLPAVVPRPEPRPRPIRRRLRWAPGGGQIMELHSVRPLRRSRARRRPPRPRTRCWMAKTIPRICGLFGRTTVWCILRSPSGPDGVLLVLLLADRALDERDLQARLGAGIGRPPSSLRQQLADVLAADPGNLLRLAQVLAAPQAPPAPG